MSTITWNSLLLSNGNIFTFTHPAGTSPTFVPSKAMRNVCTISSDGIPARDAFARSTVNTYFT